MGNNQSKMIYRQSPIFITIDVSELIADEKKHTNDIIRRTKDLAHDDRCIFLKMIIIAGKPALSHKKMITRVQLLDELIWLKRRIKQMPEDMAKETLLYSI